MKDKVLNWFAQGEIGVSSKTMACTVIGMTLDDTWSAYENHPSDPDDFRRCLLFLEAVPEARSHFNKISKLSPVWERLVDSWDVLESLLKEEMSKGNKAPKTYEMMKNLGC